MSKKEKGIGGPMLLCADPNQPSFDPATHMDATAKKLIWLCDNAWDNMTEWERVFCQSVYGKVPLSRKQHIIVSKIHKQYSSGVE